ncbi:MAG TPA: PEPxxWA-CTERM sorting domain-containing protein [Rhizomicrobium sp.]|nr:PEPxxWA-CTERM sorting domain-containing protein [Rhizomicrobium sp.]
MSKAIQKLAGFSRAGAVGAVLLASLGSAAHASTTLADNYYGGHDFYAGNGTYTATALSGAGSTYNGAQLYAGDVISDASDSRFNISDAVISRTNGGNTLVVTIDTAYAGNSGLAGTGYGALFLTPGANAWTPVGTAANHYATDSYQAGDWQYAFTIPLDPSANSGSGGLYLTSGGTIVMSNVSGDTTSYPLAGNNGYYFREDQAVQFTKGAGQAAVATGTWTVGVGQLTFSINDNGLLGNQFALSWAMTCANDVIQGQVSLVPEPGTWAMMLFGFGLLGFAMRRSRNGRSQAIPA